MSKTKSEKVKKLEAELADLQQWLDLGLVPKKDMAKHTTEIEALRKKINEEKGKLTESKDGNEPEEYIAPKRTAQKQPFSEGASISDVGIESSDSDDEESIGTDDNYISDDTEEAEPDDLSDVEEDEEDPFSDRNRWRRGILEDPDSDNW